MTGMECPATSTRTRPFDARANDTPLIPVKMSIRRGLRPSIQTRSARARSSTEGARSPNPKSTSAARSLRALFRSGATNTSRSSVNRGSAWIAIACPPIKRNRVPDEISAPKNSLQSSFRRKVAEPLPAEPFDDGETFFRRGALDIFAIEPLTFPEIGAADDTLYLHRHQNAPDACVRPSRQAATTVRGTTLVREFTIVSAAKSIGTRELRFIRVCTTREVRSTLRAYGRSCRTTGSR